MGLPRALLWPGLLAMVQPAYSPVLRGQHDGRKGAGPSWEVDMGQGRGMYVCVVRVSTVYAL